MKDLKDFLNESLVAESLDIQTAEKMVYDILSDSAKEHKSAINDYARDNRIKYDDDKLRDLANAIVDVFSEENTLLKVSKGNFKKYLEESSYFNIFSAADVAMAEGNLDEKDHDLVYIIMGEE